MKSATAQLEAIRSDAELVKRVGKGDAAAFDEFHQRFRGLVRSVVHRTLGCGADVDDVCQNAFLAIWKQAWRFDPSRAKATTWISLVTRSIARDAFRARLRTPRCGAVEDFEIGCDSVRECPMERREQIQIVRQALDELPGRQRSVVVLACLRGMTRRQIAGIQGLPVGTVKSVLRRGAERIRNEMEAAA